MKVILETGIFRLTNVRFMNDPRELKHSVDILKQKIGTQPSRILTRTAGAVDHLNEHVIPKMEERSKRHFILSLSLKADSCEMWRAYGGGDGYAFEFDIPKLINSYGKLALRLGRDFSYTDFSLFNGKMLYDRDAQSEFVDDAIECLTQLYEAGLEISLPKEKVYSILSEYVTNVTYYLYAGLYNMKSDQHSQENEYRFVIMPNPDYGDILIRESHGLKVPYIEMMGIFEALRGIWIGPGRHDQKLQKEISNILMEKKHGITAFKISNCIN
jgi:hypothetical protein